ncbi:MAG: BON domain-containing protein [Herminiimonas sp.]|nr:BON domain-containing protein [Herminiimonas sp.]
MDFRSTTARVLLLAAVAGMTATGCGKRSTGDEAGIGGAASSASGNGAGMSPGSAGSTTSGATGAGGSASAGVAIDDSIITTKLKTALLADTTLKGSDISVETRNGEVALTGSVTNQAQKDHAAKIAQALSGVKNVNNKLVLKK